MLLSIWDNSFVVSLLLMTLVLAFACVSATRFRMSAVMKNSILLPALVFAMALPMTLLAARSAGWNISLPVLPANSGMSPRALEQPDQGSMPRASTMPAPTDASMDHRQASETAASRNESILTRSAWPLAAGLLFIWLAGSAVCLVRLGRSYHSLWRLLANAHPVDHPRVTDAAEEAASALGLMRYPTILATAGVRSPVAVGTPKHGWVIWPPDTLDRMPNDQLVHVLMHEGAHVAQRDTSLRILQGLIGAIWWWHPLVHLLNRQLSRTREELCDNAVLTHTDPVQYGKTLLDIERPLTTHRSPALAVTLFPEHEQLEHRIRRLLNPRRNIMHQSKPFVIASLCFAGLAASALAGATRLTTADPGSLEPLGAMWMSYDDRTLVKEHELSFEDASQPRHLDIDIKRGDISVTAYDGDTVLVRLFVPVKDDQELRDGFQSVIAPPLDFAVRQNANTIELDANAYEQITHVEVLVPRRVDLTLDSYRTGVIRVAGVTGHIRVHSQNNDVTLTDISGSADVYGYNGNFTASFSEVTGELGFETYNGNIDLTLPADLQATTYLRADREDVKSQFAITTRPVELMTTEHDGGSRSMDFGQYVVGDINGGGARAVIETTNGSITLRKF